MPNFTSDVRVWFLKMLTRAWFGAPTVIS